MTDWKSKQDSSSWHAFLEHLCVAVDAHANVAVTDDRGNITFVNDKFCEVSGYSREELLGRNHRILKSGFHTTEFFEGMWKTISSGHIWRGQICNRAKSGKLYWMESTIVPFLDETGRPLHYVALRTEITRLKDVEEALGQLTRDLEKRVADRTAEIAEVNAALQGEMEKRRVANEKLAQRESLYRLLFQSVTDYFYTVEVRNGAAHHTEHTGGIERVTGYSAQEFAKDPLLWIRMVVPEDRDVVEAQAQSALKGNIPPPLEHRIVRKDGDLRWIRNTIVVRRDAHERIAFYDGIISDITAGRLAQEEIQRLNQELEQRVVERTAQLKAANEQIELLFEHAPVGISWVEKTDSDIYHLNPKFCEIIGLSVEEARSLDNIMGATHPEDRARQMKLFEELWSGKRDEFTMEKRYVHRDGSIVWAILIVIVLRDKNGQLTQQFAMLEDITEQREAQENLRLSEQRFRRYVENASETLYSLSADGLLVFVSPTWTAKLGHAVQDVMGRPMADFIHPNDLKHYRRFLEDVLEYGRSTTSVEYRALHQDGKYRWHASSGAVYTNESGERLFMGVARDVSGRIRSQEELRAALAQREELASILHRSPSIAVLWRAAEEAGWPVEFISQNISKYGYSPQDFLSGKITFSDLMHPKDRDRVQKEVGLHALAAHGEYSQEYRILTHDGEVRWVDDRTVVRIDPDGRVTHHEGILNDITERKEAEQREAEVRERELRTAREVQRHLLPDRMPDNPHFEVDSLYVPSRHVGGDYYDFLEIGTGVWGFVVADVSGKGASAALVMAACRATLRLEARRHESPLAFMKTINRLLYPDMPDGMFISLVVGILDQNTGSLTVIRAGHEMPIIVRGKDGAIETPNPSGLALGMDDGPLFDEFLAEQSVQLHPGDLFVFYTDGITEAMNDAEEEFGRNRLAAVLATARGQTASRITEAVDEEIVRFAGTRVPGDDRTLLVVRMK